MDCTSSGKCSPFLPNENATEIYEFLQVVGVRLGHWAE